MKIFLMPNTYTEEQVCQAAECVRILEEICGHSCALEPEDSSKVFPDSGHAGFGPSDCDIVASLGGDGSVLKAASTALEAGKPLLGINSGRVGFLCEVSFSDLVHFNEIFEKLSISRRHLISVKCGDHEYTAVNDIVFGKKSVGSTLDLRIRIDDEKDLEVRGDGLIFATATGSTAYNLSAGGPMLSPDLNAFVMTPICPHSRKEYPVVLNDSHTVTVSERDKMAVIYVDGRETVQLKDKAEVRKSASELFLYTDGNLLKHF